MRAAQGELSTNKLRSIVLAFRRGILGKCESDGMCFAVCAPLAGYLSAIGIKAELVEVDFGRVNHFWLKLSDGRIIDPTADQFSRPSQEMPKVYIGPVPELYKRWMQ